MAIVLMILAAALRLPGEFHRLTLEPGRLGAIDLLQRHAEVQAWFAGDPVYGVLEIAAYPPASYLMLWPLVGWLGPQAVRWFWAALSLPLLVAMALLLIRWVRPRDALWRASIALVPLAGYASATGIGNGQTSLLVLVCLLAALLLLERSQRPRWQDLLAAMLFLVTLMKPSLSAPFFWLLLLLPNRLRVALIVLVGYALLTVAGAAFQEAALLPLLGDWWEWARTAINHGAVSGGYGSHVNLWRSYGIHAETRAISMLLLMLSGLWVYRHRKVEPVLLVGAMALFARFWTYHRLYDDLLIFLAMAALWQFTRPEGNRSGTRRAAAVLLTLCGLGSLAPARLLSAPFPWDWAFASMQSLVWTLSLGFLMLHIHRARQARPDDAA